MFGVLQEYVWAKQVRQNFDPYTRQRSYTKTGDYRGKRHFRIDIQLLYFSSKLNYYFFNCASHFVSYYKERNKTNVQRTQECLYNIITATCFDFATSSSG